MNYFANFQNNCISSCVIFVQMDQNLELYAYHMLCMLNSYHIYLHGEETACVAYNVGL